MILHVVVPAYTPNTATTNRIIALLKGFSYNGVKTKVTFLVSDGNDSKVSESIPNVFFEYMWENSLLNRRFLCRYLEKINFRKYVWRLPRNATVLLPFPSSKLMSLLVNRKDLKVYYEETELPELYSIRNFDIAEYFKSIRLLDGLFVISSSLKDYFIKQGISEDKVQIVNMFVDKSRFENVKTEEEKDNYIAYCGTVTSNKDGIDDLIRAFAIVRKSHPDVNLYIIGPIPKEIEKNSFYKLVDEYNLKDCVHFTGIVSYQDMPQMLKHAKILALARPANIQARYGFPTKLGEYLLTGNPVVVTNVGDIPLFLQDGKSAMIAKPEDADDFANKLCWLLDHPNDSILIGSEGKNVALSSFNNINESEKIIGYISKN